MKRLIKKSMMDIKVLQGTLDQLGDDGREILKGIEDYKFKLDQASRITATDQMLTQKIVQKRKVLDAAAAQIYGIVFDIENMDITQSYTDQQMMPAPGMGMDNPDSEETLTPGIPPVAAPGAPVDGQDGGDAVPMGGGGDLGGGGESVDEEDEDEDADSEDESLDEEDLPEEPEEK